MRSFRHDDTTALVQLLDTDEERVLHPEVIYAFGCKQPGAGAA